MQSNRTARKIVASQVMTLLALPLALQGCTSPSAPPPVPSGGQSFVLSYTQFADSVEPILVAKGCDATGDCHGGGIRGTLELSPPGAKDTRYDFNQVVLQVSGYSPSTSPILTRPLVVDSGGTPHPYKPFGSTHDPGYLSILGWILNGVMQ